MADDVDGTAIDDGVAGCASDATEGVVADEVDARKSYWHTVRSVDAANAVCPFCERARSKKGFAAAVCHSKPMSLYNQVWGAERGARTIVPVHTAFSTSHVRTVESNPLLYALAPLASRPKTTRETRAV